MKRIILILMVFALLLTTACKPSDDETTKATEPPVVSTPTPEPSPTVIEETKQPVANRSIFNGKEIDKDQDSYQAFAIIIENTGPARPHSALGLADIVYENAVETYTITRFLAIFASEKPSKVGPVRSSRIPFVRIAQEWGLPYAHFGSASTGQGDAKSLIKSIGLPMRFDGHLGINDQFYSRDKSRKAPHNAYFNAEAATAKIPELEYKKLFDFDETTNIDDQDINRLSLRYSKGNKVDYKFESESKSYLRYINDEPMMDAYIDDQIRVTNIVLLHAPHTMVEKAHYVLVDFLGEGKAEYFVNGKYEQGTWKKASYQDKTEYFDSKGDPIILLPGNTWIQVVHKNVTIRME